MHKFLLTTIITGLIYTLHIHFPPVFANRITEANYDNLKIGMTYQEVMQILGREGEIYTEYSSPNIENSWAAYRWVNNDGTGIIGVFNSENQLIKLTTQNLNATSLGVNRESPVVTSRNIEEIKVGMSYDEVTKIIGNTGTKQSTRNNTLTNANSTEYVWLNSDGTSLNIVFDSNQKVVNIRTQNMNTYNFGNPFWNQPKPVYAITREKYEQLQLGMTYQEVINILETEGELDTQFNPEAFEQARAAREMQLNAAAYQEGLVDREQVVSNEEEGERAKNAYQWMNPDQTGIKVVFNTQDRAVAIYTFGLGAGL